MALIPFSPSIKNMAHFGMMQRCEEGGAFQDVLYAYQGGIATINRPRVPNAFRAETVEEILAAMGDADIGVIVLAGASWFARYRQADCLSGYDSGDQPEGFVASAGPGG